MSSIRPLSGAWKQPTIQPWLAWFEEEADAVTRVHAGTARAAAEAFALAADALSLSIARDGKERTVCIRSQDSDVITRWTVYGEMQPTYHSTPKVDTPYLATELRADFEPFDCVSCGHEYDDDEQLRCRACGQSRCS